jgi:hypothetical protein
MSLETREIMRQSHLGKKRAPFSAEHIRKIAETSRGRKMPPRSKQHLERISKALMGRPLSEEHRKKVSLSLSGKTGDKSRNWRGGLTSVNNIIRGSTEYKLWRQSVFERDNWTCIWCGKKGNETGGILNADHIKPFCDYPELRFAIDNGRTLCVKCHRTTETYGSRVKNYNLNK